MSSPAPADNGTPVETEPKSEVGSETETDPAAKNTTASESSPAAGAGPPASTEKKWPGWPGDCVFRLIVPVLKVGSIIGRKGDIIKKMCEETRARIRVLDGPVGNPDRIVLISGKEETEEHLSPAMDAVIRVFKRVNEFPESEGDDIASIPFCSIRLLVPSTQAMSLIGKQGSLIKSIQESTACSVRVLSSDAASTVYANSDDKVVDLQGEALQVLKALEAVIRHLWNFVAYHSVLPLFAYNAEATQDCQVEMWTDKTMLHAGPQPGIGGDYPLSMKRETLS